MAVETYSADKGQNYSQVTKATSGSTSTGLSVVVDLAKLTSKKDLLLALEAVVEFITRDKYPPA